MSAPTTIELLVHGLGGLCLLGGLAVSLAYGFLSGMQRYRRITQQRRHRGRLLDLEDARTRRQARRGGPGLGVVVWANAADVEAAWASPAVPRLVQHLGALHASSERLLDAAEIAGYDPAFCERLRRLHAHLGGLAKEYQPADHRTAAIRRMR